jgi:hypothetical protein
LPGGTTGSHSTAGEEACRRIEPNKP